MLQQGGTYSPPYVVYQPIASASESTRTAAASASAKSSKDLTDKDILEMLEKMDGLPSDMAIITRNLRSFYLDQAESPLGIGSTSNIALRYLNLVNQIKVANFNKKEYDNAWQQVTNKGGLNELAITDRGQFVCKNEDGNYKLMTAEQLKESEGYTALTNNDLLQARAESLPLANKNEILAVVRNGIGMAEVTKEIQQVIEKIGTSEVSGEGYLSTQQGKLIHGLEDFQAAVQAASGKFNFNGTVNDLYKYKLLTKEQASQAQAAMTYVYSTLSPTAKALLKSKTDLTDKGALQLLQTLVASTMDSTQTFDIDLEGGKTAATKSKTSGTGGSAGNLKATQLVDMQKSFEGSKTPVLIDRGDGIQMTVMGRQFPLVQDLSGKAISNTSLANMLAQSGIQGIVKNMRNITFGDQTINPEVLSQIAYTNTGVTRANLPIKPDGTVNLALLEAYADVERKIDALGRTPTDEEVAQLFKDAGLSELLKADGTPNEEKFGSFLITEGYTTDALSGVHDSEFVKEFKGNEDMAEQIIKQSLTVGTGSKAVVPDIDRKSIWPWDWGNCYDKIYRAAIYIPIDNNTLAAARIDGQKLDYDEASQLEKKYQNFDKALTAVRPDLSVLGLNTN